MQYTYGEPHSLYVLILLMSKGIYINPESVSEVQDWRANIVLKWQFAVHFNLTWGNTLRSGACLVECVQRKPQEFLKSCLKINAYILLLLCSVLRSYSAPSNESFLWHQCVFVIVNQQKRCNVWIWEERWLREEWCRIQLRTSAVTDNHGVFRCIHQFAGFLLPMSLCDCEWRGLFLPALNAWCFLVIFRDLCIITRIFEHWSWWSIWPTCCWKGSVSSFNCHVVVRFCCLF